MKKGLSKLSGVFGIGFTDKLNLSAFSNGEVINFKNQLIQQFWKYVSKNSIRNPTRKKTLKNQRYLNESQETGLENFPNYKFRQTVKSEGATHTSGNQRSRNTGFNQLDQKEEKHYSGKRPPSNTAVSVYKKKTSPMWTTNKLVSVERVSKGEDGS